VDTLFAPDDQAVPPPVQTPPAQLPLPFIRSAKAAVVKTVEPKNAIDSAIAKALIAISSSIAHCERANIMAPI
jgi:hypothetical protein